ncbi:MAG: ATP-binding cassette domain-containing protein [Bacteroidales bacterium]|nr:ATP-binding cassette domain-containing protein [Bacteroidales bacterium]
MLIELKNVALSHDDTPVISQVNFQVGENDFIYIVGKVGSGKSTLLKALYGEVPVCEGEARILDFDLRNLKHKHLPALRRKLGIVFQDFQLLHHQTVQQNLDFVLRATGWKKKQRPARILEVLQLVQLTDKAQCFPHELSGGEQQRVCIARALLNHPQIILADEPIGNLDTETSRHIMQTLLAIREQGTAIVMVTHNLNLLEEFPGIVYRCEGGELRAL